mmetsp:Transcript_3003/g.6471  ORF Transcript_3003/g.6471 Transcript_3003/m.6471 type:complete len:89 (-) Transcript_3003:385-651(-)
MVATKEEMVRAGIPVHMRDNCAHLLIPLGKCRVEGWYLFWNCKPEKIAYEKCQHYEYLRRVQVAQKRRDEKLGIDLPTLRKANESKED